MENSMKTIEIVWFYCDNCRAKRMRLLEVDEEKVYICDCGADMKVLEQGRLFIIPA